MKIDAHQHFWIYSEAEYGWITDELSVLRQDFLPPQLAALQEQTGFDGSIAVQARQIIEETDWLLDLVVEHPRIMGVVGWLDLCSRVIDGDLERYAAKDKLCGVRHIVHDEPDDEFLLREDFLRGIGLLSKYDLTYDILIFPRHLPVSVKFVAQFPEQSFVVDHIAKPLIKDKVLQPWADDIRRLANFPNVWCKLSGMVTEADWAGWEAEDFHPYLDVVVEAFGPDRLMIGSDWPVCTVSAKYADVMGIVRAYICRLSADEQAGILGGNAARFYGIERSKPSP